jgi:hypothetical protein
MSASTPTPDVPQRGRHGRARLAHAPNAGRWGRNGGRPDRRSAGRAARLGERMKEAANSAGLILSAFLSERSVDCAFGGENCLYTIIRNASFRRAAFSLKRPFPAERIGCLDYCVFYTLILHVAAFMSFRRAQLALDPCLKIWDLHWSDVIALDTLKLATACFDDHEAHRLAAFRADRAERVYWHGASR